MATKHSDDANVNRAYQNAWIVYINGLEVPVTSVSVSYGVWEIPRAEIVMVPDPVIQRLGAEDRIAVQIFFCDHWIKPNNPEFRLLFDGEIIGWSYVNVQRGRSVSFTAVDYIQIFTQLFFFFMSSIDDLAVGALGQSTGVTIDSVNTPGFAPLFPYSLFSKGLIEGKTEGTQNITSPLITRPIEYVYNVVTGLTNDLERRSIPAANFYSPWARRTRFTHRFVALPYLETGEGKGVFPILRSVQADWAISAVAGLTANVGTAGSIWHVFEEVLSTLMMELAMIPTAPSVAVKSDLTITGAAPTEKTYGVRNHLASYFVKPQFLFGLPPTCNVFYPSQITQFGYQENYATQPTRMYFNDESWTSFLNPDQRNNTSLDSVVRTALTIAHPEEVNLAMLAALNDPKGQLNGKNVLVYPEEFFRGPVVDRRTMPRWFLFLNNAQDQPGVETDPETLTEEEKLTISRNVPPGEPARNIFRKYAAYEYMKERYARRTGGLSMAFNPYPIPGFPCAVFDRRSTKVDIFAYVMNVRHVLSSHMMQTDVSMSYGRTMQEAFALVRRTIEIENATALQQRAEINRRIRENNGTFSSETEPEPQMERVGAIAMGPAEPLTEIRDRIQNFERADQFYRSLLYRAKTEESDETTKTEQSGDNPRNSSGPDEPIQSTPSQDTKAPVDVDAYLRNKDACFKYNKIIQISSDVGKPEFIKIQGIEAKTRFQMITILEKMRSGTATDKNMEFIRNATSQPDLQQQAPDATTPDPSITQRINQIDIDTQNNLTLTNLHGQVEIDPTPNAAVKFENFEAAMSYNARPICTLDEYLVFLGPEAALKNERGAVNPGVALAHDDSRAFPAKYYRRIRRYRAGPPSVVPATGVNVTGAIGVTTPDGTWIVLPTTVTTPTPEPTPAPTPVPTPETPNFTPETPATPEPNMSVADPAKLTSQATSIPDDFPQTAQNWDTILEIYRANVLSRLAPGV